LGGSLSGSANIDNLFWGFPSTVFVQALFDGLQGDLASTELLNKSIVKYKIDCGTLKRV